MYVSAAQLRDAIGAKELSSLATPETRRALGADKIDAIIAGDLAAGDPDFADATQALATINEALSTRSNYVDGYLAARYTPLPIADPNVPDIVRQIVIALARFDLAKNNPTDTVTRRYTDARQDLADIAAGVITLPLPSGSATSQSVDAPIMYLGSEIYTMASTRRFQNPEGRLP